MLLQGYEDSEKSKVSDIRIINFKNK